MLLQMLSNSRHFLVLVVVMVSALFWYRSINAAAMNSPFSDKKRTSTSSRGVRRGRGMQARRSFSSSFISTNFLPHEYTSYLSMSKRIGLEFSIPTSNLSSTTMKVKSEDFYYRRSHTADNFHMTVSNSLAKPTFPMLYLMSLRFHFVANVDFSAFMHHTIYDDSFDTNFAYYFRSEYLSMAHLISILKQLHEISETESGAVANAGGRAHELMLKSRSRQQIDAAEKALLLLQTFGCVNFNSDRAINTEHDGIRSILTNSSSLDAFIGQFSSRCIVTHNVTDYPMSYVQFEKNGAAISGNICKYLVILDLQEKIMRSDESLNVEKYEDIPRNRARYGSIFNKLLERMQSEIVDSLYSTARTSSESNFSRATLINYVKKTLVPLVKREKISLKRIFQSEIKGSICDDLNVTIISSHLAEAKINSEVISEVDLIPQLSSIEASSTTSSVVAPPYRISTIQTRNAPDDEFYKTSFDSIILGRFNASAHLTFRSWSNDQIKHSINLDASLENSSGNLWIYNIVLEPISEGFKTYYAALYPFGIKQYLSDRNLSSVITDLSDFTTSDFAKRLLNVSKNYHNMLHKCFTDINLVCKNDFQTPSPPLSAHHASQHHMSLPLPAGFSTVILRHPNPDKCVLVANRGHMSVYHYTLIFMMSMVGYPFLYDFSHSMIEGNSSLRLGANINVSFFDRNLNPTEAKQRVSAYMHSGHSNQEQFDKLLIQMFEVGPIYGKADAGIPKMQAARFSNFSKIKLSKLVVAEPDFLKTPEEQFSGTYIQHNFKDDVFAMNEFKQKQVSMLLFGLGAGSLVSFILAIFPNMFIDFVEINESVIRGAINLHFTGFCDLLKSRSVATVANSTGDDSSHHRGDLEFYSIAADYGIPSEPADAVCRSRGIVHDASTYAIDLKRTNKSKSPSLDVHRSYHVIVQDIYGLEMTRESWDGRVGEGLSNGDWEAATRLENIRSFRNLLVNREGFGIWHIHQDSVAEVYVRVIKEVFGENNVVAFRPTSNGIMIVGARNVYANQDDDVDGHVYRVHPCLHPDKITNFVSKILSSDTLNVGMDALRYKYTLNCNDYTGVGYLQRAKLAKKN